MAESNSLINFAFDPQRKLVRVALGQNVFVLDLAGVDDVLTGLGQCRALMDPPEKTEQPGNERVVVKDTIWQARTTPLLQEIVVHVRDPRFGWLNYALNKDVAYGLGQTLVNYARSASAQAEDEATKQ